MSTASALVQPKHSLATYSFVQSCIARCVCRVKEDFPQFPQLKMSVQLTRFVCELVMAELRAQPKAIAVKVDGKALVTEILALVFGLSDEEKDQIAQQLEFIAENKLAKRVPYLRRFLSFLARLLPMSST